MYELIIPLLIACVGIHALVKHVDVFPVFIQGANKGLQTAIHILPAMIALLTAVYMLRASGFIDIAGKALEPLFSVFGIPKECASLVLLKPLSGSGGLALGSEIMKTYGPDSYAGRTAAVMLGASETSLYTIGIYCGHIQLKRTRYMIPAACIGDWTAFICSALLVRLLM